MELPLFPQKRGTWVIWIVSDNRKWSVCFCTASDAKLDNGMWMKLAVLVCTCSKWNKNTYYKLTKIHPPFWTLLRGKNGRRHLLEYSISLMHTTPTPAGSSGCYSRGWQSWQVLWLSALKNSSFTEREISHTSVNTQPRGIKTTCIVSGYRGWSCVRLYASLGGGQWTRLQWFRTHTL